MKQRSTCAICGAVCPAERNFKSVSNSNVITFSSCSLLHKFICRWRRSRRGPKTGGRKRLKPCAIPEGSQTAVCSIRKCRNAEIQSPVAVTPWALIFCRISGSSLSLRSATKPIKSSTAASVDCGAHCSTSVAVTGPT